MDLGARLTAAISANITGRPYGEGSVAAPPTDFERLSEKITSLPPSPRAIMTHHSVPYGRAFKQWMTNGDLIVWANRGEIEDMPHRSSSECDPMTSLSAIPVINT